MKGALIYQKRVSSLFLLPFSWVLTRNLGVGSHHFAAKSFRSHFFLYCSSRSSWLWRKNKRLARKWKHASQSIIFFNTPLLSNTSVPDPVAIYVYLKWEEWEKIGVIGCGAREAWEGIPRAPQANTNLLSPQRHVNSDRERVSLSLSPGLSAKQRRY